MVNSKNGRTTSVALIIFSLIIFLFSSFLVKAQEVLENAPPNMRWHQINTPHFKIIFPEGFDDNAQSVANKLEQIYEPVSASLDVNPKKIPIILQNRTVVSNGFVSMVPRRSEFYTMPPQDYNFLGTNTWLDLIATHEYRHVVQYQHSLKGLTKIFHTLFGQYAQTGLANAAVPRWFFEGDATLIETLYTPSGRGRIPDFNRIYRANLLSGKDFKYTKQHLGSYKDQVPNHYVLGYNYVTHLRRRTNDPEIWEKVTGDAFKWSVLPYSFSQSLNKHTGMGVRKNYRAMQEELYDFWGSQLELLDPEIYDHLIRQKDVYTDFSYPLILTDNTIVVQKEGLGDVLHFVRLDLEGNQLESYIPGVVNRSGMFSAAGTKIVWNEVFPDIRWGKESASVIKTYDFSTNELNVVTSDTRYTGADLSPTGREIVTALTTEDQQHYLVVINARTGEELTRFSTPDNDFLSMARFSDDGEKIVSLMINENGKGVVTFDVNTGEIDYLVPVGTENIGYPVLHDNFLFFNSPYNGLDNVHALDLSSGQRYQLTNSKFGAYNPEIDAENKLIWFNNHEALGMNVASLPFDTAAWIPYDKAPVADMHYFEPLLDQENMYDLTEQEQVVYEPKRFRAITQLINPHSWGPIASTDLNSAQFALFSEDLLKTTVISAGYEYNINNRNGYWFGDISYQGFFPILNLRIEKGERSEDQGSLTYEWDETTTYAGVRIPLNLTRSKFFSEMSLGYNLGIRQISDFTNSYFEGAPNPALTDRLVSFGPRIIGPPEDSDTVNLAILSVDNIENGTLAFDNINFSYYALQKQSPRDLNSRWGMVFNLENYQTRDFFNNTYDGNLFAIRSTFYLPSPLYLIDNDLMKHHSLFIRFGFQNRKAEIPNVISEAPDLYFFQNRIPMPRGYAYPFFEDFTSWSFNYKFPLFYPDWVVGPFLYIKRVKINTFLDHGQGTSRTWFILNEPPYNQVFIGRGERQYTSVGAELTFDINLFRFPADIDLGVRWAYAFQPENTPDGQANQFEFLLLNINF